MGLFDKIFKRQEPIRAANSGYFELLNGYTPIFYSWGGNLYESELVRASIEAKSRHVAKLGISIQGTAKPSLQKKLKVAPNQWQTWSQFLARLSNILDVKNTAFICPVVDEFGDITGVYPIYTDSWELIQFNNEPYIRFKFGNGQSAAIELVNVGIMTRMQLRNDFFGESNTSLTPTMELINLQNQAISEGVKSGASYQFMATLDNWTNDADLKKERERFTRDNLESGNGVLLWPKNYKDVKQLTAHPYVVDPEQMKLINTRVYNYFGVNEDVLQNKAYGDSWSAFYEGAIEPFAVQLSEVLTKMLFTLNEQQRGSSIIVTANRLQHMSNKDKLEFSIATADRGLFNRNEIREVWNAAPIPGGDTFTIRGEYYQLNEQGEEVND